MSQPSPSCSATSARGAVDAAFAAADAKLQRLAELKPVLIDVSLREPCFSGALGHTLANKIALLELADAFGATDKIIATLDYQLSDYPQVEDDFCGYLQQSGYDMRYCFAATTYGKLVDGDYRPHISMEKLVGFGIANTIHEVTLAETGLAPEAVLPTLTASIGWLRAKLGPQGRIYINIVDLIDGLMWNRDLACQLVAHLGELPINGISFEDDRGTFFPFQVGAAAAAVRALLPAGQQVLLHCHAGNGMENASVIEALLNGADGYWGGMDRESSTIGHAAVSELIANLARAGNDEMARRYQLPLLLPTCQKMHEINTLETLPATWPIQGSDAYCSLLTDFDQTTRPMDLAPETIGGRYTHRIAPVGSDWKVIVARVREALGQTIDQTHAERMILSMRQALRDGERVRYDEPAKLAVLVGQTALST